MGTSRPIQFPCTHDNDIVNNDKNWNSHAPSSTTRDEATTPSQDPKWNDRSCHSRHKDLRKDPHNDWQNDRRKDRHGQSSGQSSTDADDADKGIIRTRTEDAALGRHHNINDETDQVAQTPRHECHEDKNDADGCRDRLERRERRDEQVPHEEPDLDESDMFPRSPSALPIPHSLDGSGLRSGCFQRSRNGGEDDDDGGGWKIIYAVLKGWFLIWILFAILTIVVITSSHAPPSHSRIKLFQDPSSQQKQRLRQHFGGDQDDEQLLLTISEQIVTTCSEINLGTQSGRLQCQALCRGRSCCFTDDGDDGGQSHHAIHDNISTYGCANDPDKMCAVYAGCEILVLPMQDIMDSYSNDISSDVDVNKEDHDFDQTAHDADVFDDGDMNSSQDEMHPQQKQEEQIQKQEEQQKHLASTSEIKLISHVIDTVCSHENLSTHHGLVECASLCKESICCFDPDEIKSKNPNLDYILGQLDRLEGGLLNRTAMGTCLNEQETQIEDDTEEHFCRIHAGCKHLLLFGSPMAVIEKERLPSHSLSKNEALDSTFSEDPVNDERRMLLGIFTILGMLCGLTIYMLVCRRYPSTKSSVAPDIQVMHSHQQRKAKRISSIIGMSEDVCDGENVDLF